MSVSYFASTRENQITVSLERCAAPVKRSGKGHWEFSLANGKPLGVSARVDEDWLVLDAPLPDRAGCGDWCGLAVLNATLHGFSKFVLTPAAQIHLRADIPLSVDEDSESECEADTGLVAMNRLWETCAGLKAAFHRFRGEKTYEHLALNPAVTTDEKVDKRFEELRRLCGDTGWPFNERSGRLMVDLDVRSDFYQAAVEQRAEGAHVSVEVARFEAPGEASLQALSRLLLETGALIRLARPSITPNGNQIIARFEVGFATMPAAIELTHALSSLSVACAMSGGETRAIQDELIARDYLAILGAQASLPASSSAAGD